MADWPSTVALIRHHATRKETRETGNGTERGTESPQTVTVCKFLPNTVTGLKVAELNYTSAAGNSAPLTEG
jgi:hypothetical protein